MKKAFCLSVLLLICGAATAQKRSKKQAPSYGGLTLGKSKQADVARVFGKPARSGHPEDEYDNPVERQLSYEYENVGGFKGRTVILMDARSRVVTDIFLYPSEQQPLSLTKALEEYGTDYIERESGLGPCPTAKELRNFKRHTKREYPIFLVYPHKGVFVSFSEDEHVKEIGYMLRCP